MIIQRENPERKMTLKKYMFGGRDSSEINFNSIAKCIERWIIYEKNLAYLIF